MNETMHREFVLRPAWRAYWPSLLAVIVGLVLVLVPDWSLARLTGLTPVSGESLMSATVRWLGAAVVVVFGVRLLIRRYWHKFVVSRSGVERCLGIISRDNLRIEFGHIRSVGLRQSVMDRLLGIGSLEFASAGTGEVDIIFHRIARPGEIREQVEARLRDYRDSASMD